MPCDVRLMGAVVLGFALGTLIEVWQHGLSPAQIPTKPEASQAAFSGAPTRVFVEQPPKPTNGPPQAEPQRQSKRRDSRPQSLPEPIAADGRTMELGREWLHPERGGFPPISARYAHLGFPVYAAAMERVGGRFFLFDGVDLRAEIDRPSGHLLPIEPQRLRGLSPRSRDLSDEPALARYPAEAARARGPAPYRVVLLVPAPVDQAIVGAIAQTLEGRGIDPSDFTAFEARYHQTSGGELILHIDAGRLARGGTILVDVAVNLSRAMQGR